MNNPLVLKAWSPYVVGALIGLLCWFTFASVDKPIGVTTAFEHTAALAEKGVVPDLERSNEYYAVKAAEGRSPQIGWEWMLVVGVFFGALFSSWLSGDRTSTSVPTLWENRFGPSRAKRLTAAFFSAALMMFGARLAQGALAVTASAGRSNWRSRVGCLSLWRLP